MAGELGQQGFAGNFIGAFGTMHDGTFLGGVAFHNFYPDQGVVELTAASIDPRWLTRRMIRAIFNYAFVFLEAQIVVMRVGADNSRMLNIARRFGFNLYTIPRLRGKDEGEVICTLHDDQWRDSPYNGRP